MVRLKRGLPAVLLLFLVFMQEGQSTEWLMSYEGGVTAISQRPSDERVDEEWTASADLRLSWERGNRTVVAYFEANSTPDANGVATVIPESNVDAGTALDEDRRGRAQLSELYYSRRFGNDRVVNLGLIDPSAYMDTSRITNDENLQFLGVSFVNNPTIEFPDYTVGGVFEQKYGERGPVVRLIVTSSNGLADNTNVSYAQVVDIDDPDKGLFIGLRTGWKTDFQLLSVGVWWHTAPHVAINDAANDNLNNQGAYIVYGWQSKPHAINVRLGIANDEVTSAADFYSVAYRFKYHKIAIGAGYAVTKISQNVTAPGVDDTQQSEVYFRYTLYPRWYLTASIQNIKNSAFDATGSVYDADLTISGLRLTYQIE